MPGVGTAATLVRGRASRLPTAASGSLISRSSASDPQQPGPLLDGHLAAEDEARVLRLYQGVDHEKDHEVRKGRYLPKVHHLHEPHRLKGCQIPPSENAHDPSRANRGNRDGSQRDFDDAEREYEVELRGPGEDGVYRLSLIHISEPTR